METVKDIRIESEQQGDKEKKREGEREKKTRGRPTKAEELAKQRERTESLGSVKEFLQKRKRKEIEEEAARAEKEIIDKFNEARRVNRSPAKIKKEEEGKGDMATEELFREILRKMEEQEKERKKDKEEQEKEKKKDKEEIKNEIKGLKEEWKRNEEKWEKQREALEERIKNLEEKEGNDKERKEKFGKLMEEINKTKKIIEEIQEIGNENNRMRLIRCKNWESKRDIMKRKKELGKKYGSFLDDDLTSEERRIQIEIRKIAREKREKGKRVTVGYQKIWEDNKEWRWNESKGELEERNDFRRS